MLDPSFDRIAKQYSLQRAHPPDVSAQMGQAIVAEVGGSNPKILELGVGTGRIAFPVISAGGHVIGIDIALEMLRAAQREGNAELLSQLQLVQGNICNLPFPNGYFDAVMVVHVLHLVPDVRQVLIEVKRVMCSGGVLVQGRDWNDPRSVSGQLRHQLRMTVMALSDTARPPSAMVDVPSLLQEIGASEQREVVAAVWYTEVAPRQILDGMARRDDAETWALSDDLLAAAVDRVRAWAISEYGDLEQIRQVEHRFILNVVSF
jgi:ubiquinone/menaquinone biosynthesis C-methylase UbiE